MMNTQPHGRVAADPSAETLDEQQLHEDIAYFERRLAEMGSSGDCAYERALASAFRTILDQRKNLLAGLQGRRA